MKINMKVKTILPLVLALLSIVIFVLMILKNEHHLNNAQSVYVRLQPVDPRSILQGDYMALNYDLGLEGVNAEQIENQAWIKSYAQLDAQNRVIKTRFDAQQIARGLSKSVPLILKNPDNLLESLYPAANSFLFAEGLEPCYRNAQYAHLSVKADGQTLLLGLADQNLKSLNCESQKQWKEGNSI